MISKFLKWSLNSLDSMFWRFQNTDWQIAFIKQLFKEFNVCSWKSSIKRLLSSLLKSLYNNDRATEENVLLRKQKLFVRSEILLKTQWFWIALRNYLRRSIISTINKFFSSRFISQVTVILLRNHPHLIVLVLHLFNLIWKLMCCFHLLLAVSYFFQYRWFQREICQFQMFQNPFPFFHILVRTEDGHLHLFHCGQHSIY